MIDQFKKELGIKIKSKDSNWISMNSDKTKDWENEVEKEMKKRNIKFVIFFLSKRNNDLYKTLKIHSLCEKGYVSQVIKFESLQRAKRKGGSVLSSYISKILLQINCKLGGANYLLNLDNSILQREIMFIGLDFGLNSSHVWKKREKGVITMVATKDKNFSKFYPQNEIINCGKKNEYILTIYKNITNFIEKAIVKYEKEEKHSPKNIIFYRQGISEYQVENIKNEVKAIEEICNKKNINYYYVIVNAKTSLKIFELNNNRNNRESGNYKNPEPGLVLLNKVTDKNKFEFYIQPQFVNQGTATPSHYQVMCAYQHSDDILKLEQLERITFYLCYYYFTWSGAIREPGTLKMAETALDFSSKCFDEKNMLNYLFPTPIYI